MKSRRKSSLISCISCKSSKSGAHNEPTDTTAADNETIIVERAFPNNSLLHRIEKLLDQSLNQQNSFKDPQFFRDELDLVIITNTLTNITFIDNGNNRLSFSFYLRKFLLSYIPKCLTSFLWSKYVAKLLNSVFMNSSHLKTLGTLANSYVEKYIRIYKILDSYFQDSKDKMKPPAMSDLTANYQFYINFGHQTDIVLNRLLTFSHDLMERYKQIIWVYDQYVSEFHAMLENPHLITNFIMEAKLEIISYNLRNVLVDDDFQTLTNDIRYHLCSIFNCNEIMIDEIINYKRRCLSSLKLLFDGHILTKDGYSEVSDYFGLAEEGLQLKTQLFDKLKVVSFAYDGGDVHFKFQMYSDIAVPVLLRVCHHFISCRQQENRPIVPTLVHRTAAEKILLAYKKKKYGPLIIHPYIEELSTKNDGVDIAEYVFRSYIINNREDFIPQPHRYTFGLYAKQNFPDLKQKNFAIMHHFSCLSCDNKERVIFVFDHIIKISNNEHQSPTYIYRVADIYAKVLLDCANEEPVLSLFSHLLDMYRTGLLSINEYLIEAVNVFEMMTKLKDERYTIDMKDNANTEADEELNNLYESDKISTRLYIERSGFQIVKKLVKTLLSYSRMKLSNDVKMRIFKAIVPGNTEDISFVGIALLEAYFHIPKYNRIFLSFMLSHLSRISAENDDENEYLEVLADVFHKDLLKFEPNPQDPPNIDTIMKKALENLISFCHNNTLYFECDRLLLDFFIGSSSIQLHKELSDVIPSVDLDACEYLLEVFFIINGRNERMKVTPDFMISSYYGKFIRHDYAINAPYVNPTPENESYPFYTIIMINPDYTNSSIQTKKTCVLHWMVVNMALNDRTTAEIISEYMPPSPILGAPAQRFILLCYGQQNRQNFNSMKKYSSTNIKIRSNFNVIDFQIRFNLKLEGCNYFYCERRLPPTTQKERDYENLLKQIVRRKYPIKAKPKICTDLPIF